MAVMLLLKSVGTDNDVALLCVGKLGQVAAKMTVWGKRWNINTAALVTKAQCNTLVARCSKQLIRPADWVFITLGPLRSD